MERAWLDVNHTWSLKWWISKVHSTNKDKSTVTAGLSNSAGERSLCLPPTLIISQSTFVHRNDVSYWFVEQAASCLKVSLLPTGGKLWVSKLCLKTAEWIFCWVRAVSRQWGKLCETQFGRDRVLLCYRAVCTKSRKQSPSKDSNMMMWSMVCGRQMWKCETFSNPLLYDSNRKMDPICPLPTFS